jgi:thiol-disulfide isomerase/thioredoxin
MTREWHVEIFHPPIGLSPTKANSYLYASVRRPDELATYILSSTSSGTPLITLWTASWCPSCRIIKPLINSLIGSGVGEPEGGVTFSEVELDSQDIMESGLGMQYMITSMPTLLTFDRGEAIPESRTMDTVKMKDKKWLKEWIEGEARRRGYGTGGAGGLDSGLFGGLFGDRR